MENNLNKMKVPYTSCIRINGVPILPPLVNTERREELIRYKKQAINIEQERNHLLELRKNRCEKWIQTEDHSEVDKINDEIHLKKFPKGAQTSFTYVPYKDTKHDQMNLTRDLVDLTEYSDIGMRVLSSELIQQECDNSIRSFSNVSFNTSFFHIENKDDGMVQEDVCTSNNSPPFSPKPRLVRSNSYILDNPSPLLLAHLEKQSMINTDSEMKSKNVDEDESSETLSKSIESQVSIRLSKESTKEGKVRDDKLLQMGYTIEHHQVESEFAGGDNVLEEKCMSCSKEKSEDFNIMTPKVDSIESVPVIELITTDIKVQQFSITTSINNDEINEKEVVKLFDSKAENQNDPPQFIELHNEQPSINDNEDPEQQLMSLLKQIPDDCSKQILGLIQKQKLEQQKRMHSYENLKKQMLERNIFDLNASRQTPKISPTTSIMVSQINETGNISQNISTVNEESSLGNRFSQTPAKLNISSSTCSESWDDTSISLPTEQNKILEVESDLTEFQEAFKNVIPLDVKNSDKNNLSNTKNNYEAKNSPYCSRELFPKKDPNSVKKKVEWAASKIGAAARGYLVRRLIATERVQTLIETIKDALFCAIELHGAEIIDESDVELHRRLIQQVSSACYAFHDLFFSLSIREQMNIISLDRERKMQRAFKLRMSRSSSGFTPSPKLSLDSANRLSKSLTKV